MIVLKEFEFDAAHYLPSYNGKCEHLHGHTYKLVVKVDGRPDMEGMVLDFSLLKKHCNLGLGSAGQTVICGKPAAV